MIRLTYQDLKWEPVFLRPEYYTEADGVRTRLSPSGAKAAGQAAEMIRVEPDRRAAFVCMPAGQGKITDAGYDQMACLYAKIPACGSVRFKAIVRVLRYPDPEERNGQEGAGLFFRDTMELDPLNGYPYSNMAAGGFFRGAFGLFGRDGITRDDVGHVRNFSCSDSDAAAAAFEGKSYGIALEKQGNRLIAEIKEFAAGGGLPDGSTKDSGERSGMFGVRYETAVDGEIFSRRGAEWMALGFFAARGCELEVDLDSVSVEYDESVPEGYSEPAYIGYSGSAPAGCSVSVSDEHEGPAPDRHREDLTVGCELPVLYASPEGSGCGDGTPDAPLDLQSAIGRCGRGQEIRVMPGRYRLSEDLIIARENSGTSRSPKKISAEGGFEERAILDFGGSDHSFRVEGDCWEISGLTVTRGFGFQIRGSHNRIFHCRAVSNLETGFLIRHPLNGSPKEDWPSYNEIADCISCMNRDVSEQNADGFACKVAAGPGNTFLRCTAFLNSDDGFDLFSKNRRIGAVRLVNCKSYLNGYKLWDGALDASRGNGNGFKLGGSGLSIGHEASGCIAVGNRGYGFTSNSNPYMKLTDCRAGNNGKNYVYYFTGPEARTVRIAENCAECNDPAFDPAALARKQGLLAEHDLEGRARPGVLIMCSSLYGGGAERVACHLACGLAGRYRVTLLYIQDKGQTYPLDPRIEVVKIPAFPGSWEKAMESRIAFTRQLKKDRKIRTSISFMFTMNKINVRSRGSETVICSERNNPAKRDPEHLKEIEGIYEAADHVVFQSAAVRDLFSRKVREHCSIILNPVEVSCGRRESRRRIVNVGRLVPQKNQAMLIRAFAAFYRSHPEYTLSFYGTGELEEKLRKLADSLGIGQAVRFHGHVREVHEAIADAEIFALSSDYEGLSNALLECMTMGLPCVSTRCEGSVDVIRSGENGLLVDVGSEGQMAAALTRLAEDEALRERLGAEARKTSERFRKERVLAQWEELIGRPAGGR